MALSPSGAWRLGACVLLLLGTWPAPAAVTPGLAFDPASSRFGFELRTRWGLKLDGRFPEFEGGVATLADGNQVVRLRMLTESVEIEGYPRYTEWTRGSQFFEADRYPAVVFVSHPYDPALLVSGGALAGDLSIRGITRPKTLDLEPSTCARPAVDCDVVATGTVRRSDYDMDAWMMAVGDRVVFLLRARLHPGAVP